MSIVSIRLPDDVSNRLKNLSEVTGRSKTDYIVEAIKEKLDEIENIYIAEKEIQSIQKGDSTTMTLSELMNHYDKWIIALSSGV